MSGPGPHAGYPAGRGAAGGQAWVRYFFAAGALPFAFWLAW